MFRLASRFAGYVVPDAEVGLPLLEFTIDGRRLALHAADTLRAEAIVEVTPLADAPAMVAGVVNYRGEIVPVFDLRRRLGCPARDQGIAGHLIFARTTSRLVALPVDQVIGVMHVAASAVTPAQQMAPAAQALSGIVALPDGVMLIHDPDGFLSLEDERRLDAALARPPA
jgi:purine-binding chemotaxis protein CheW